jgi:hypothetical protein
LGGRRLHCAWRAAAKLAQALLELPVTVLQLLILAGHLPELVFQPLDAQLKVCVLGERGGSDGKHRGSRHGRDDLWKSG